VSPPDGAAWRVIRAAMPALWVLGVEALRFTWRRLHEDPSRADVIPAARWLAAPWPTLLLWRRMKLGNVTDYARAVALEDARLHARDLIRAASEADPHLAVPAALRRSVRSGRLPASVAAAVDSGLGYGGAAQWEPEVAAWVTSRLTLPDRLAASLRDERQAISAPLPGAAPAPLPEPAVIPAVPPSRKAARHPSRPAPRRMTDDELMPYVRALLDEDRAASIESVIKATGTGRPRARKLLERGRRELEASGLPSIGDRREARSAAAR
jgi:hypothetical protein